MSEQSPQSQTIFLQQKEHKKHLIDISFKNSKSRLLNKSQTRSEINDRLHPPQGLPNDELSLHLRMKDKFDELYKKIQRISATTQHYQFPGKMQKRYRILPNDQINDSPTKKPLHMSQSLKSQLMRVGSRSIQEDGSSLIFKRRRSEYESNSPLKISTVLQEKQKKETAVKYLKSTHRMRMKIPQGKQSKMSNNIKDYLSVQKIRLKDLQDSMIAQPNQRNRASKLMQSHSSSLNEQLYQDLASTLAKQLQNNILVRKKSQSLKQEKGSKMLSTKSSPFRTLKNSKFNPPFETYYYRDLIWRIAYSNQQILQMPSEYEAKIRVFVGRGNNSRLVKSIIARRSWYQITDKIEDASVIWTQIKVPSIFNIQSKTEKKCYSPNKREHRDSQKAKLTKEEIETKDGVYHKGIWSWKEEKIFNKYFFTFKNAEERMNQAMNFRNKHMKKTLGIEEEPKSATLPNGNNLTIQKQKIQNHFIKSYIIGNKKALFQTMSDYYEKVGEDVFKYLPMTFHICNGLEDDKYLKFLNYYYSIAKKQNPAAETNKFNAWIVKPGQNSNRGQGITVCLTLDAIKAILKKKQKHYDGSMKTYILQKYIERPLLYKRRKFDLRHYIMVNCSNGMVKGYWYRDGYARTTSTEYSLRQGFNSVHLTNDAVQKNLPDYGKYEKGNKISYDELHDYLLRIGKGYDFFGTAYPRMKKMATDILRASASNLDPEKRTNFQIFGLDFMLDENLDVWLIEVNTNPCLEVSCPLLAKIIPKMIQQTIQISLDPLYPPPTSFNPKGMTFKQNCVQEIAYELIYDQRYQQQIFGDLKLLNDQKLMKEEDDCFDDDGEDWNED